MLLQSFRARRATPNAVEFFGFCTAVVQVLALTTSCTVQPSEVSNTRAAQTTCADGRLDPVVFAPWNTAQHALVLNQGYYGNATHNRAPNLFALDFHPIIEAVSPQGFRIQTN